MKENICVFYDLDDRYKNPVSAVREQEEVCFRIYLDKKYDTSSIAIQLINSLNKNREILMLSIVGGVESYSIWECNYIPKEIGVYWYNFKIITEIDCVEYVVPNKEYRGYITSFLNQMLPMEEKYWRVTIFSNDFTTPEWIKGGIVYQIFPDRFRRSIKDSNGGKCVGLHEWEEFPHWKDIYQFMSSYKDFYGGNIDGIVDSVEYLEKLSVNCIYLNPIFKSSSSHRYDTSDYEVVDPLLGNNDDFVKLCEKSKEKNIRVVLDGVFSHTGSDSKYFDIYGTFNADGAYQKGKSSIYYPWYTFYRWPNYYNNWWNFDSLPKLNLDNLECKKYFLGEKGVVSKWLELGASGWRLDAADDLIDEFLCDLRACIKNIDEENLIIGEVWHDASLEKYVGHDILPAQFLLGKQLDTVTNYQFRDFVIEFFEKKDAKGALTRYLRLINYYPKPAVDVMWNLLGSHDTERIINVLGQGTMKASKRQLISDDEYYLSNDERVTAEKLLKIAVAVQYTMPGVPCIYYGDELGVEGYNDPYNRCTFDWNEIGNDIHDWYEMMGKMRKNNDVFIDGQIEDIGSEGELLCFKRFTSKQELHCYFNISDKEIELQLNICNKRYEILENFYLRREGERSYISPFGVIILNVFKK